MKVYEQEAWSLNDLFLGLDDPAISAAARNLQEQAAAFAELRAELGPDLSPERFAEILQMYEAMVRKATRLIGFARLSFAANTQDQQAQGLVASMQQLMATTMNQTMFFELWWKELDDDAAERLQAGAEGFHYWLEALRNERPYTLTEPEEKIINLKNVNGVEALETLYDAITNRYTFKLEVDGIEQELTRGELQVHYRSPDPALREAAYQELYRVYGADTPILGQIYQYRVRDWRSEKLDLRKYESPIAVRNRHNDIPDEVVETLLEVAKQNVSLFHRYFRLKAYWLGMEKLRRYDIYAPVVQGRKSYGYDEAAQLVLESFRKFEPRVADLAQRVFDERHLDGEVRKGKMSGAFCSTIAPDLTPWVLQSFQERPDDVATMAHELGHAIHSMLAEHHNALAQHASLPLAETASTFGEMLVIDQLLETDPDPDLHRDLLFRQMDDAFATILRQIFFAIFERDAHQAIADGASIDQLCELYIENLRTQFGDAVEVSDDFRFEWTAIPHIYQVPFYVYAYAFGQLLVFALYQQYRQEGDSFKPRYLEILAAGGSDAPARILQRAGIDIASADFWQGGFDVIAGLVEQLEQLELPVAA